MKHWHEECAVFGVYGDPEAGRMAYLGLYAQQHRGQESTGIVTCKNGKHIHHKGLGLVGEVFPEEELVRLKGEMGIGHCRYSTTGGNALTNTQPLTAQLFNGPVAIAHNGNVVNSDRIRDELKKSGAIFQGTNDTESFLHLIARSPKQDIIECIKEEAIRMDGAYSVVLLTQDKLVAFRDPKGFRPLSIGHRPLDDGGHSVVIASETCAFDLIGAKFVRDIEPGEIFWVDETGEHSVRFATEQKSAFCIFEHVYFSRPDSKVFGIGVYESRKEMGRYLARENPISADMVIPVPDSGVPAAIGYSEESGIPFEFGIIRNHYIGRTFIQPSQSIRSFGVKIKLNPQSELIRGKDVVIVDDSIVRGTTSRKIIALIRAAGARKVHMRIAAPPTKASCYYGVDTPETDQLIANQKSVDEICQFVGADSLAYLSMEGLMSSVQAGERGFCAACFGTPYPTELYLD
ncbi:MAG: amidophosphoribosyltransferase [Bdellovibrionales bacterium]|nr:amidophosphoribosyltransferase [Bdellovibrionales bacterium]